MTHAFHVDRWLAPALVLFLAAGSAIAQEPATGSPVPLTPQDAPPALEAPPPGLPGALMQAEPADEQETSGIEVGELKELDPDSGGILDRSLGGLGVNMWRGTERSRLLQLLPQLPANYESPVLHDLARRLLLSTAVAPPRREGDPGTSLIGLRIEKLAEMGLAGAVADMMAIAPSPETDPVLMRIHIDNRLLLGDYEGACEAANSAEGILRSPYRDEMAIFCTIQAGQNEAASFSINLLRESGELEDPAFFTLADALTAGTRPGVKSLPDPGPIHLAMAEAAGAKLPADVLETKSPLILRALADSPLVPAAVRLAAAERAALAGALAAANLAERYADMEFSGAQLDNALSLAGKEHSPRNRALLYQAAHLQSLPVAQAAAMQKAWELARADGIYRLSAEVYRPELEALQPSPELMWFAPQAIRTLLLLNRPERALAWASMTKRSAREPEERQAAALLWPLVALAEGSATGAGHDAWVAALSKTDPSAANRQAGLSYSLLEAMGEHVSAGRWESLLHNETHGSRLIADPAYMRAFRLAASAGRRGETVLLAILILGNGDLGKFAPDLLSEVTIGLRKADLEDEARQLATEAAIAAGL